MIGKNNSYFNDFIQLIDYSCQAAVHLQASLLDYNIASPADRCVKMKRLESQENNLKASLKSRLLKEFIPPLEREDIISLANALADITDKIGRILIHMDIYRITKVRPAAHLYAAIIVRSCHALRQTLTAFPDYHKSNHIAAGLLDINNIKAEGDKIYIDAVRELYANGSDPVKILSWSKIFDLFSACSHAGEYAAEVINTIIVKNG